HVLIVADSIPENGARAALTTSAPDVGQFDLGLRGQTMRKSEHYCSGFVRRRLYGQARISRSFGCPQSDAAFRAAPHLARRQAHRFRQQRAVAGISHAADAEGVARDGGSW